MSESRKIHVWIIELDKAAPDGLAGLSQQETARASRFAFERDRRRYQNAHAARRAILGAATGVDPTGMEFAKGPFGKPHLVAAPGVGEMPHFNQSTSGDLSLLAVSWDIEIGVDLERLDRGFPTNEVADWAFDPVEQACLSSEPDADLFWRIWTRKEALLKAMGTGLHREPRGHRVCPPVAFGVSKTRQDSNDWWLHDLTPAAGYAACVAVGSNDADIVLQSFYDDST